MNWFLSFLVILCLLACFAIWVCAIYVSIEDAQLWLYKQKEQQELDSEYIENAENEKDRKLSAQLDSEDFFNE